MKKADIGLMGLGIMGENLALNMESKGYRVGVYNRTNDKTTKFIQKWGARNNFCGAYSLKEFVDFIEKPRKIFLMVKSGKPIDDIINQISPLLSKGDIIIDGGNSHFGDTERRGENLKKEGILYLGCGISGGEEGALHGPCIMPGGNLEAYDSMKHIFDDCAAKTADGTCSAYMGSGSAGHYVKMVHNGIEYGIMQLIAETYDIMRRGLGFTLYRISNIFSNWNSGELSSYLVEITANILKQKDGESENFLVDMILDKAGQKGTGKWTSQSALDIGVADLTMHSALSARTISGYMEDRIKLSAIYLQEINNTVEFPDTFIKKLENSLLAAIIITYSQGMSLLSSASKEYRYNLSLSTIARIWKGGCIIRAAILDKIENAYKNNTELSNLLADNCISSILSGKTSELRDIIKMAIDCGIPTPAFSASLNYFDLFRTKRLPVNLIQAQRDYFGAHTYERTDRSGIFHTKWMH